MAIQVPKFATEAEEADWWYENREALAAEALARLEAGEPFRRRAPSSDLRSSAQVHPTYGMSPNQIVLAHQIAEKRGISLSEYLMRLIAEGLERDRAA